MQEKVEKKIFSKKCCKFKKNYIPLQFKYILYFISLKVLKF